MFDIFCNSICYLREYKIEEKNYNCKQNKWIKYNIKHWYYFWNGKDNRKREREEKYKEKSLGSRGKGKGPYSLEGAFEEGYFRVNG